MTREERILKRLARLRKESERKVRRFQAKAARIMAKSAANSFVSAELAERMRNGGKAD